MESFNWESVGARVKQVRSAAKETQDELAEMLDLEKASISRKERGRIAFGAPELLIISNRYGVSVDWLLTGKASDDNPYSQKERNLIDCYRTMTTDSKSHLYDMAIELALEVVKGR